MTHTPGPWHFDREGDFIYSGTLDDIKHIICDIRGAGSNAPMDANAELITQAPVMKEKIERLEAENQALRLRIESADKIIAGTVGTVTRLAEEIWKDSKSKEWIKNKILTIPILIDIKEYYKKYKGE